MPGLMLSACLSRSALTGCRAYANLKGIVELYFWTQYGVSILDDDSLLPQGNGTPSMSWGYFVSFYIFPIDSITLPVCTDTQTQQGPSLTGLRGPWGRSRGGIDTSYLENMSCAPPEGTQQYKFKHFRVAACRLATPGTFIQTQQSSLTLL